MDALSALILGAVQGLTEFLPISSSGHLILAREVLGLQTPEGLAVDAVLQLATVMAVGVYFFRDLLGLGRTAMLMAFRRPVIATDRTLLVAIVMGTVPAVAIGLPLEHMMDTVFRDPRLVAATLIAGSGLFWYAESIARKDTRLSVRKGIGVGLFQTLALIPGVSRSGATISGGLILGLTREDAARFSFLLSFPVILGSGLKKLIDLGGEGMLTTLGVPLIVGFITAFVVGMAAIHWLLRFLKSHTLIPFAVYRGALAFGAAAILVFT